MRGEFRITKEEAFLHAPLTEAASAELRASRPERMQLVGDWGDLTPLSEVAPAVKNLTISGDIDRGRIAAAVGLERFTSLTTLHFASQVKKGYDLRALPALESVEAVWQPDLAAAFEHPTLRSLTIRSFPLANLGEIRIDPNSKLGRLWIANTKLEGLAGIDRLQRLEELRITDAKRLTSLAGLRNPSLRSLDIENAAALTDLSSLDGAPRLKLLRLLSTSTDIDLAAVNELEALESLQVGGRIATDLDWMRIASSPTLRRVFAWWNSELAPEAQIRERATEMGRSIQRFEPVAGRGRRPVLVEWA